MLRALINGYKAESIGQNVTKGDAVPMKLTKVLTTLTPLMLIAGAAFAATSGLPADAPITTFVHFISTDVAYGAVGAGFAGIAAHCISGRELGFTMQHSVGALIGGGLCSQVQPAAAALGLSAGATLGSLQISDHHRLVAFVLGAAISTIIGFTRRPTMRAIA
jgi:hypothetical protein